MLALLDYEQVAEIEPGRYRPLRHCTTAELERAMKCQQLRQTLKLEAEALLSHAAARQVDVPQSLRNEVSDWCGDAVELGELVEKLREVVSASSS